MLWLEPLQGLRQRGQATALLRRLKRASSSHKSGSRHPSPQMRIDVYILQTDTVTWCTISPPGGIPRRRHHRDHLGRYNRCPYTGVRRTLLPVQASQSRSRRERLLLQTDTHRELVTCPGCDNFRLCVWVCDTVCVFVLGSHVTCWFVPALQNSDSLQRCVWLCPGLRVWPH